MIPDKSVDHEARTRGARDYSAVPVVVDALVARRSVAAIRDRRVPLDRVILPNLARGPVRKFTTATLQMQLAAVPKVLPPL